MTYGNGLIETVTCNNRLQPTQLRNYNPTTNTDVLNLSYGFTNSAGANNGNVVTFNSTATQIFMRTYTYDELNRLSTMSSPADASGCYGLTWTYDAWGNRLSQNNAGGSCVSPSHTLSAINRIIDTGYVHDAAGNMTGDNIHAYVFNAESQLTQVDSGSTATYLYDANGQRVRKTTGGVATDYVYDGTGLVAEIQGPTWTKGYVHSGTQLVAQYNGAIGTTSATTLFSLMDHLGSTRILSTVAAGISDSMDYLPYGELISGGSSTTHKFTGKERDAESGLDDFEARFYGSSLGRFTSPDPLFMNYDRLSDPQQLNLYSYVRNNPLNLTDPTGLDVTLKCKTDADCKEATGDLNNRDGKQFDVTVGKDGKLGIAPGTERDKLTSDSEKALYDAITDTKNHATVNVQQDTGTGAFGVHDGQGVNTVDLQNMSKLDASSNKGGLNSGDGIAHEVMDAYLSISTKDAEAADQAAGAFFPGLSRPGGPGTHSDTADGNLVGSTLVYRVLDGRGNETATLKYKTPIPLASLQGKTPTQVRDTVQNSPIRVTGVTFDPAKKDH